MMTLQTWQGCTAERTRVGFKLEQVLMPGRHQNASYFREGTRADAVITPAYTFTARLLHWTTAVLILSMIPLGVVIANEWGGSAQDSPYDLHRSIGAAIIPLVILRIIYRWTHPPRPLPDDIPSIQKLAAHTTQGFDAGQRPSAERIGCAH
jgi:hypothetical protein